MPVVAALVDGRLRTATVLVVTVAGTAALLLFIDLETMTTDYDGWGRGIATGVTLLGVGTYTAWVVALFVVAWLVRLLVKRSRTGGPAPAPLPSPEA